MTVQVKELIDWCADNLADLKGATIVIKLPKDDTKIRATVSREEVLFDANIHQKPAHPLR